MSNATDEDIESMSDEELEKKALAEAGEKQSKAEPEETEPEPETVQDSPQADAADTKEPPVTPSQNSEPVDDRQQGDDKDPMERARRKGLDTPEALARSLAALEDEFHRRNQAGHPGYRDVQNGNPAPQPNTPPNWTPKPTAMPPGYGYPQTQPAPDIRKLAQQFDMDPEDFDRIARLNGALTRAAIAQERERWETEMSDIKRQAARSSEFNRLMQDPDFSDPRVQKEMREVLKDGSLFQRGEGAYITAFHMALTNLARKTLQQESTTRGNANTEGKPPVTAGGGNGSANTGPHRITEKEFLGWTEEQQKAFLASNGAKVPRR